IHVALDLELAGGIEQYLRAENVGADERSGVVDAAVNVTFGGEVQNRADARTDDRSHRVAVGDVALDKAMARVVRQVRQVRWVAGVSEAIEVDNRNVALHIEEVANEVAANESAAAGHQNRFHECPFLDAAAGLTTVLEQYPVAARQVKETRQAALVRWAGR